MEAFFGDAEHEIINHGVNSKQHTWTSRVYFQPRYCLWMTATVELNSRRDKVDRTVGRIEFGLIEYMHIAGQEASVAREIRFGAEQWARLVIGESNLAEMFGAAAEPSLDGFATWAKTVTGKAPLQFPGADKRLGVETGDDPGPVNPIK